MSSNINPQVQEVRSTYSYNYHPPVKAITSAYSNGGNAGKPAAQVSNYVNVSNMAQKVPYSSTSVLNPKPGIYAKPTVVSHKPLYGADASEFVTSNYSAAYMKKPLIQNSMSALGDVGIGVAVSNQLKGPSFYSSLIPAPGMRRDSVLSAANASAAATYPDLKSKTVLSKYRNTVKEADDMLTEFDEKGDARIRELKTLIGKGIHASIQPSMNHNFSVPGIALPHERSNSKGVLMCSIPEENQNDSSLASSAIAVSSGQCCIVDKILQQFHR